MLIILTTIYSVIQFVVSKANINKTHIKYIFHDFFFIVKFELNGIICETLPHLNDLHEKCCKRWFFWDNFRPLFDTYWVVSQPITPSDQIPHQTVTSGCNGISWITCGISEPQKFCLLTYPPRVKCAEENFVRKISNLVWQMLYSSAILLKTRNGQPFVRTKLNLKFFVKVGVMEFEYWEENCNYREAHKIWQV